MSSAKTRCLDEKVGIVWYEEEWDLRGNMMFSVEEKGLDELGGKF